MERRITAGVLALFLGALGVQKFYLWRTVEGILCLLLCWTGLPALLGFFEWVTMLRMQEAQWGEYLMAYKRGTILVDPRLSTPYLFAVGSAAFVFWLIQSDHSLFRFAWALLFLVIWLYPREEESLFENRLARMKQYRGRIAATLLFGAIFIIGIANGWPSAPVIVIENGTNITQTGGVYTLRIRASDAERVLVNSTEAKLADKDVFEAPISLDQPKVTVSIKAEHGTLLTETSTTLTRSLSEAERAENEKAKAAAEEEAARKKIEEERCQQDPTCRAAKEAEAEKVRVSERTAYLSEWLKRDSHDGSAWVFCKQKVTEGLKSPSTADFPTMNNAVILALEGYVWIRGYVDSQNGFGATVRTKFVCQLDAVDEEYVKLIDLALE